MKQILKLIIAATSISIFIYVFKLKWISSHLTPKQEVIVMGNTKQGVMGESPSPTYYRFNTTGDHRIPLMSIIQEVFDEHEFIASNNAENADILFLDKFDDQHIFKIITNFKKHKDQSLHTLVSIDHIASKSMLHEIVAQNVSSSVLSDLFPKSFIIHNSFDVQKLRLYMKNNDKIIILKKNMQQQKGCKIIKSFDENIIQNYVIAQELLQNPFLIKQHKINIRVYILIKVDSNNILSVFMYNDGFIYYTPDIFKENSMGFENNITSGLVDRTVYDTNPLTIADFRNHIGYKSSILFNTNLLRCFTTLFKAQQNHILKLESTFRMNKFAIMGADIAIDKDMGIKIMEINKGPDLRYKDDRDRALKYNMVRDAFVELGFIPPKDIVTNFIKII